MDRRKEGRTDGSVTISLRNFVGEGIRTTVTLGTMMMISHHKVTVGSSMMISHRAITVTVGSSMMVSHCAVIVGSSMMVSHRAISHSRVNQ